MVAAVSTDDGTLRTNGHPEPGRARAEGRGADGPIRRAALIGDIGGHASELEEALAGLGCDTATGTVPTDLVVIQLGDLVDRGPDPAAAVGLADRFIRHAGGRYLQLFGNHEGQRFTDLHLRHAGPLPRETLETIQRWWTDGRAHLAVALDTQELGPLLVTHAGLSPQAWRDLGAPGTAEDAARLIERWVGHDAGRAFTPAPPGAGDGFHPGVTWGEPADVYADWLAEADPPPFGQVHGHASAWSWKHRRWRKRTPAAVRAAAVAVDADRCHVQVRIGGRAFVGIDPGHLEEPRRPWAPLLLTIAPAPSGPATDGPERGHRGPPDR